MSTVTTEHPTTAMRPQLPSRFREARALIGWLDAAEAKRALTRDAGNAMDDAEAAAQYERARQAVAARTLTVDVSNAVLETPPSLDDYIEKLKDDLILSKSFGDGWSVRMIDLTKISPIQAYVFADHAMHGEVQSAANDPVSLANITLPIRHDASLPFQYSREKHAWVFTSDDFNLREVTNLHSRIAPAVGTFGFVVSQAPSSMRVVMYRDRLILQDGTHRAYGLLRRGVSYAPVFFRKRDEYPLPSERPAMLPQSAVLGPRPPYVADFLRPEFYSTVSIPLMKRMLVIQASEYSVFA